MLEKPENSGNVFKLIPKHDDAEVCPPGNKTEMINLIPKQIVDVELYFSPNTEGEFRSIVKIHIINNPFEHFLVSA